MSALRSESTADGRDPRSATSIDQVVGAKVRLRRMELGFSQETLANRLGITFQQVQKYERGANRVAASRLHQIATVLQVPLTFFFQGTDAEEKGAQTATLSTPAHSCVDATTMRLLRAFSSIEDRQAREHAVRVIEVIADATLPQDTGHGADCSTDVDGMQTRLRGSCLGSITEGARE